MPPRHLTERRFWSKVHALRGSVRASEVALTLVAVIIGVAGGVAVAAMYNISHLLHAVLFNIAIDRNLSASTNLNPWAVLLIPAVGGLLLGGVLWVSNRIRNWPMVDVIEANALHGGKMSMRDSLMLGAQTLLSNGFGASVGLEAGYTQVSSAISSKVGEFLHLRRNDMRVLVGCGAAAAISAAFDAPLAGAFYAFELVIGTYTIAAVAPVMAAALAANLTVHALHSNSALLPISNFPAITNADYLAFIFVGFICGFIGIGLMRGVTLVETMFRKTNIPPYLRPAVGGLAVGCLGLVTPQVLGSGHGVLHLNMEAQIPLLVLFLLFMLKSLASAISLGSGFRGGLFLAAMFLGALLGKFLAELSMYIFPLFTPDPTTVAIIGMSALAVAVVGGPLTMAFLALEATGDFVITGLALTAAVISSLTVRELFGYSFSTWRLHLRGESIRSAHDVGWVRSLTVGKLMQTNVVTCKASSTLNEFRRQYPIGSLQMVIAVDDADRYAGLFWVSEAYTEGVTATRVSEVMRQPNLTLTPNINIKQAIAQFEKNTADAIAVVENGESGKVIGLLTEAFALKRYAEELDKAHRNLSGTV